MNRIFFLFIMCVVLYACKPGIPKDIIQPDKMEKVLFDIHIVDGYIGSLQKPDTAKIVASSYYTGVYKKFEIDSAIVEKSKNYYYTRPDLLDKMYSNLVKQLEKEKKRDNQRITEEALAAQRRETAKHIQALAVPNPPAPRPTFKMGQNPFNLFPLPEQ